MAGLTGGRRIPLASVLVLLLFVTGAGLFWLRDGQHADLHTVMDTSIAVLSGILAALLWDMARHTGSSFVKWLGVAFAMTFVLEIAHVIVNVDWEGALAWISDARAQHQPSTWSPAAYLLPLAISGRPVAAAGQRDAARALHGRAGVHRRAAAGHLPGDPRLYEADLPGVHPPDAGGGAVPVGLRGRLVLDAA